MTRPKTSTGTCGCPPRNPAKHCSEEDYTGTRTIRIQDQKRPGAYDHGHHHDQDHLELGSRRELAAGELKGDLHAPVPDVVVVLHQHCNEEDDCSMFPPTCMPPVSGYHAAPFVVPFSNCGAPTLKGMSLKSNMETTCKKVPSYYFSCITKYLTRLSSKHSAMVERIGASQVLEHIVVRCERRC